MLHILYMLLFPLLFAFSKEQLKPNEAVKSRLIISPGYFISPVKHDIKLAGTFCELRPNHFHTGIDIKSSAGVSGDNIYAVADGFVSRIGVSPKGYGYALYIDHPNGYTSVYGHLFSYNETIAKYLLQEQIKHQRFDVQLYLDSSLLHVKKGHVIGKMGNTGSSNGAHLHFEIRETVGEIPVNPLLFGIKVNDIMAPGISYARIYDLDSEFNEYNSKNLMAIKRGPIFVPKLGDTVRTFSTLIGLGINTRDGQNGNWNKNGIYEIKLFVDDTLIYKVKMDSVSFEQTRMINAHLDYPEQKNKKNYVHKCYSLPGNVLRIIQGQRNKGVIQLEVNKPKKVKFIISDFNKNVTVMQFIVLRKVGDPGFKIPFFNYKLPYNEKSIIVDKGVEITFPDRTFFNNQKFSFNVIEDRSDMIFSNIYNIGNVNIPILDYFTLRIQQNGLPVPLRNKAFIASCDSRNKESNWGGTWDGDWMTSNIKTLGSYYITVDTIAPRITPIIFNPNMTGVSKIVFRIDDNILPAGQTELLNYNAYLDGRWIVMTYDLKTKSITYVFSRQFPKGSHNFKLEVYDAVRNISILESKFVK